MRSKPVSIGLTLLTTALFVTPSRAQYQIRGEVEAGQVSTCYYCPTVTSYVIHGSETPITSSSVSLASYVGQHVILTGNWGTVGSLPIFDVTAVQATSSSFSINGNSSIGSTVHFTATAPSGDLVVNIISMNAGVVPLSSEATLLLNPGQLGILDAGFAANGQFETDLAIPSVPSLVGLHFFGQALILPASGAPLFMSEPDAKRIH